MAIYFLESCDWTFYINSFGMWIFRYDFCDSFAKILSGDIFEIFITYFGYDIDGILYSLFTTKNIENILMDTISIRKIIIDSTR